MIKSKKTVFVGVSGGVDSAVSAALLKDQGFNVVGVFIRSWMPDFINCTWREERRDAMRICAHLKIPFLECNAEKEYKKNVADYMIKEYQKGRTPNPDVMCNRQIKFGTFWKFAQKYDADYIATGHYAVNESRLLKCNKDTSKDQSYFLWTLTQEDLSHSLFPVGHLKKTEVRKLAEKYKLPIATKKDSQGVCFLGPLDMKDFLKHYIKPKEGNVLNLKKEIIGKHNGAVFFTLGERRGFTITKKSKKDKPCYVVTKDIEKNTITVSALSSVVKGSRRTVSCTGINWITEPPKEDKRYQAQIRYHGELLNCKVKLIKDRKIQITFRKSVLVDGGQSIVIYDNDVCLGGGIVE